MSHHLSGLVAGLVPAAALILLCTGKLGAGGGTLVSASPTAARGLVTKALLQNYRFDPCGCASGLLPPPPASEEGRRCPHPRFCVVTLRSAGVPDRTASNARRSAGINCSGPVTFSPVPPHASATISKSGAGLRSTKGIVLALAA